jgi:hypothetical protein
MQLKPDEPAEYYGRGNIKDKLIKHEAAIKYFKKSLNEIDKAIQLLILNNTCLIKVVNYH